MSLNKTQKKIVDAIFEPLLWFNPNKFNDFKKESENRAEDISNILTGISSIKIEKTIFKMNDQSIYSSPLRNIKDNKDLARMEFRGAIQRYLLGFYNESITSSCNSIEMALLIEHKKRILNGTITSNTITERFTFGSNKALACDPNRGFINDTNIKNILTDIVLTRNMFAHQNNFMSPLIQSYKIMLMKTPKGKIITNRLIKRMFGIDTNFIEEFFKEIELDENDKAGFRDGLLSLLPNELKNDIIKLPTVINNLWDYAEFTNQANLDYFDKIFDEFIESDSKYKLDIFYFLSNKTLNQAFIILKYLDYF